MSATTNPINQTLIASYKDLIGRHHSEYIQKQIRREFNVDVVIDNVMLEERIRPTHPNHDLMRYAISLVIHDNMIKLYGENYLEDIKKEAARPLFLKLSLAGIVCFICLYYAFH